MNRRYEIDPETGQIEPTHEELMRWHVWINEHEHEFERKYAGKYLAIWDNQVVGVGDNAWEARRAAERWQPGIVPLVTYIPTEKEAMLLV
jgi:recombinational DNA repair ATPase RecF